MGHWAAYHAPKAKESSNGATSQRHAPLGGGGGGKNSVTFPNIPLLTVNCIAGPHRMGPIFGLGSPANTWGVGVDWFSARVVAIIAGC